DCPQPGDIPRSERTEEGDDVPPCGYECRWGRAPVTPGVPVAVHLVAEAHDDRVMVGADCRGEGTQVAVVVTGCDPGEADPGRVDLHEGYRAVVGRGGGEACLEGFQPSAVVGNQPGADPGCLREGSHPGIRVRDPVWVSADIRHRPSGQCAIPGRNMMDILRQWCRALQRQDQNSSNQRPYCGHRHGRPASAPACGAYP